MISLLVGMAGGAGLWLVYLGWRPRPEPLARALARLEDHPTSQSTPTAGQRAPSWDIRLGATAARHITPLQHALDRVRADLRVMGRSPDELAGRSIVYGTYGLLLGPWLILVGWVTGSNPPPAAAGALSIFGAIAGALAPWATIRDQARTRRRDALLAITAWCDMVSMSLAAGRGVDQAVTTATNSGDGFAFAELRVALRSAYLRDITPWDALDQLGLELAMPDLRELGSTIALAGEDGAAVREAITTKATTLRDRITSETERAAELATAKMGMPSFIVGVGFLVFIGYPALAAFSAGL